MKQQVYLPFIIISAALVIGVNYLIPFITFFWMNNFESVGENNLIAVANALVSVPVFIYSFLELLKSLREKMPSRGAMFLFILRIQGFIFIFNFTFVSLLLVFELLLYFEGSPALTGLFSTPLMFFIFTLMLIFMYVLSIIMLVLTSGLIILIGVNEKISD